MKQEGQHVKTWVMYRYRCAKCGAYWDTDDAPPPICEPLEAKKETGRPTKRHAITYGNPWQRKARTSRISRAYH